MRLQIYIILVLSSLLVWGGMFHAARDMYRIAHNTGVVPNLHIKERINRAVENLI